MSVRKFQHFYSNLHPTKFSARRARAGARLLSIKALSVGVVLSFSLSGCSVNEHKNGDAENVHLHTPIGGLDVRTNSAAAIDIGLPVYPGAVETDDNGKNSGAADIHMSFGKWQLHVKAVEYRSNDPEFKVVAFYKKAMASYGDVLTCKDKTPVGQPVATGQGLTCANNHEYDVTMDADSSKKHVDIATQEISGDVKLLAGAPENQHIVEFTPTSTGTKFSIVSVQLPHQGQTD
ncbi:MAG: hypothetical protein ACYCOR_07820 [Acidobacteriaceae bacterium]